MVTTPTSWPSGVLGDILGGVIIGSILTPRVVVQEPVYCPPCDPYGSGYALCGDDHRSLQSCRGKKFRVRRAT